MLADRRDVGGVQWSGLVHAYGRATDTPDHLRALASGTEREVERAVDHLWSAIIPQGTPSTATGPAAIVVAGLVAGGWVRDTKAVLMQFLAEVAEAAMADDRGRPLSDAELDHMAHPDDAQLQAALERAPGVESPGADVDVSGPLYARAVLGCRQAIPAIAEAAAQCRGDRDPAVRAEAARIEVLIARLPADGDEPGWGRSA
jgi:hypothetical protein